jgi:hypothetical protein
MPATSRAGSARTELTRREPGADATDRTAGTDGDRYLQGEGDDLALRLRDDRQLRAGALQRHQGAGREANQDDVGVLGFGEGLVGDRGRSGCDPRDVGQVGRGDPSPADEGRGVLVGGGVFERDQAVGVAADAAVGVVEPPTPRFSVVCSPD